MSRGLADAFRFYRRRSDSEVFSQRKLRSFAIYYTGYWLYDRWRARIQRLAFDIWTDEARDVCLTARKAQFPQSCPLICSYKIKQICYYIRQVNGVKLADILFSLLSVCTRSVQSSTWRIYALSERLLVSYCINLKTKLEISYSRSQIGYRAFLLSYRYEYAILDDVILLRNRAKYFIFNNGILLLIFNTARNWRCLQRYKCYYIYRCDTITVQTRNSVYLSGLRKNNHWVWSSFID